MLTQTKDGPCWNVKVDWDQLAKAETLDQCVATITESPTGPFKSSGTLIRITPLRAAWTDETIDDLRDNLGRLLPPFETKDSFVIRLSRPGLFDDSIDIQPPAFLLSPKYVISGEVDAKGSVSYRYRFNAITGTATRVAKGRLSWSQISDHADNPMLRGLERPQFGPFSFEIRGWDIGPHDTSEIADRFELKKSSIRRDIRAFKGISVYRDGILVLPKSEGSRDWLGLDLRRVGRVGHRLSTTQLVGYVEISAVQNPLLEDTSDRERLTSTPAVIAFEETLRAIVSVMENERERDRHVTSKQVRVVELFDSLSAKELIANISEVARKGKPASDALPLVEDFSEELDKARQDIEERFVYYSRLASVGTIAHYLVHEVSNRAIVLRRMLNVIQRSLGTGSTSERVETQVKRGEEALNALDRLAERFAPLANRQFRSRKRSACIEESILSCAVTLERELKTGRITMQGIPREGVTYVAIDPAELDIVLFNLLSNAIYWLTHSAKNERCIEIQLRKIAKGKRVQVSIHDSGPGVREEDLDKVFLPGVTNKPGGIGMGLTVASELIDAHGGRLGLASIPKLGGASFVFDLPAISRS